MRVRRRGEGQELWEVWRKEDRRASSQGKESFPRLSISRLFQEGTLKMAAACFLGLCFCFHLRIFLD